MAITPEIYTEVTIPEEQSAKEQRQQTVLGSLLHEAATGRGLNQLLLHETVEELLLGTISPVDNVK
jgi:hypothetical protein